MHVFIHWQIFPALSIIIIGSVASSWHKSWVQVSCSVGECLINNWRKKNSGDLCGCLNFAVWHIFFNAAYQCFSASWLSFNISLQCQIISSANLALEIRVNSSFATLYHFLLLCIWVLSFLYPSNSLWLTYAIRWMGSHCHQIVEPFLFGLHHLWLYLYKKYQTHTWMDVSHVLTGQTAGIYGDWGLINSHDTSFIPGNCISGFRTCLEAMML